MSFYWWCFSWTWITSLKKVLNIFNINLFCFILVVQMWILSTGYWFSWFEYIFVLYYNKRIFFDQDRKIHYNFSFKLLNKCDLLLYTTRSSYIDIDWRYHILFHFQIYAHIIELKAFSNRERIFHPTHVRT